MWYQRVKISQSNCFQKNAAKQCRMHKTLIRTYFGILFNINFVDGTLKRHYPTFFTLTNPWQKFSWDSSKSFHSLWGTLSSQKKHFLEDFAELIFRSFCYKRFSVFMWERIILCNHRHNGSLKKTYFGAYGSQSSVLQLPKFECRSLNVQRGQRSNFGSL